MASSETFVGDISDAEVSLVGASENVTGVVLVESAVGARTVTDRDGDDGIGGDGGGVGREVVEGGDVIGVGVEEGGDGGRGVVGWWL